MRSVILMAITLYLCAMSFAQTTAIPTKGDEVAAVIAVKTLTGDSFDRLANMLRVFNVRIQADSKLRTILVYAAPETIMQIKKVVEELDRPGSEAAIGRNVEMTLTFLRAAMKPPEASGQLPSDMESVAKQLRAATPYKHIEVWDSLPLRLQEGKVTNQSFGLPGTLPDMPGARNFGSLRIEPEAVTQKETGRYVRFARFDVGIKIPYSISTKSTNQNALVSTQFQYLDLSLNTAGDFKEGQKTVLGKLSGVEEETATFVVISLKVLD